MGGDRAGYNGPERQQHAPDEETSDTSRRGLSDVGWGSMHGEADAQPVECAPSQELGVAARCAGQQRRQPCMHRITMALRHQCSALSTRR